MRPKIIMHLAEERTDRFRPAPARTYVAEAALRWCFEKRLKDFAAEVMSPSTFGVVSIALAFASAIVGMRAARRRPSHTWS